MCRFLSNSGGDGPCWIDGTRFNISLSSGSVPWIRSTRPSLGVDKKIGSSHASINSNTLDRTCDLVRLWIGASFGNTLRGSIEKTSQVASKLISARNDTAESRLIS